MLVVRRNSYFISQVTKNYGIEATGHQQNTLFVLIISKINLLFFIKGLLKWDIKPVSSIYITEESTILPPRPSVFYLIYGHINYRETSNEEE